MCPYCYATNEASNKTCYNCGKPLTIATDVEKLSNELIEIDGIIGLATADEEIKRVFLEKIIDAFDLELYNYYKEYFRDEGMLKEYY